MLSLSVSLSGMHTLAHLLKSLYLTVWHIKCVFWGHMVCSYWMYNNLVNSPYKEFYIFLDVYFFMGVCESYWCFRKIFWCWFSFQLQIELMMLMKDISTHSTLHLKLLVTLKRSGFWSYHLITSFIVSFGLAITVFWFCINNIHLPCLIRKQALCWILTERSWR